MRVALDEHRRVLARLCARGAHRLRRSHHVADLARSEDARPEGRCHLIAAPDRDHGRGREPGGLGERGCDPGDRRRPLVGRRQHVRIDIDRVEDLLRPRARSRVEQRERRCVRVVDAKLPGDVAEHVRTGRHEMRGCLPRCGLLISDPERLEHGMGRVQVRADGSVERRGADALGDRRRLILGATIHPDHRGTHRATRGVTGHHPIELRPERQTGDRRGTPRTELDQPPARTLDPARPRRRILLRPSRMREGQLVRFVGRPDERTVGVVDGAVRALAAHIAPDHERAAHGRITIFNPVPDRIVSKASAILSSGKRCVTTRARSSWRRSR